MTKKITMVFTVMLLAALLLGCQPVDDPYNDNDNDNWNGGDNSPYIDDKLPVIIGIGGVDGADGFMGSKGNPRQYALDNGYAIISFTPGSVAADSNARTGAFYTLYPYSASNPSSQTGVLMAWAWGVSKIIDALEAGAGEELGISSVNTIVTGTSRYGKAAAVAGAFEYRIKITVPASSGAGGAAIGRYNSAGQTYDLKQYFAYNGGGSWTVDGNNPQPFSSIKGDSGGGWFNAKFQTYSSYAALPFDQHFLLALTAASNRFLFMVNGFEWDKWTNVPGFFLAFEETKPVFDVLDLSHNIAVSMHRSRHGMEHEDMVKLINYANHYFFGKTDFDFSAFYDNKPKPSSWDEFLTSLHTTPFSPQYTSNNTTYKSKKPNNLPDVLTMNDGTKVTTAEQWAVRRGEIKTILQNEAYGRWRNGTGEVISYVIKEYSGNNSQSKRKSSQL